MYVFKRKSHSLTKRIISYLLTVILILGSIGISGFDVLAAGAPTALPATNIADNSFTANWSSMAGTNHYYLDVATDSNFINKVTGYDHKDMGTSTAETLTGLNSVANYFYRVKADTGIYSNTVYVQTPAKNGEYSAGVPATGGNEYSISTPAQLKALADNVNAGTSYDGVQFKLADNIDLAVYKTDSNGSGSTLGTGWMPIGISLSFAFKGKFDGNGYVVKNMYINRTSMDAVGLFGVFNGSTGEIKNLGVVDCDVTGAGRIGAIVGWAYDSGSSSVTISESFSTGSVKGNNNVGGIVGEAETKVFTVKNCYSSATIKGTATGKSAFGYGGIVGYVYGPAKTTSIINCYSTGAVEGPNFVGGIIGSVEVRNTTSNPATAVYIKNCVALNKSITSTFSGASTENTDGILTESSSTATTTSLQNRVVGGIWENIYDGAVDKAQYTVSYTDLYGLDTIPVKWNTNTGVSAKTQSIASPDGASITSADLTNNAHNWTNGSINDAAGTIAAGAVTYFDYTEAGGANSVWYYYQNKQVLPVLSRYLDNYQQVLVTPASLNTTVPYATNVYANSTAQSLSVGNTLTAAYTYNANGAGTESGSTFKWYRYDTDKGGAAAPIAGAATTTYTLTAADTGKYISFEVTPSNGSNPGSAVESERVGPIIDTANANLINLTLSSGVLSPDFAATTTAYSASVANSVSTIAVTPTVSDANATVTVNGNQVTSGAASGNINLNVGSNIITVLVTAQNGTTTKTYTVSVTRAAPQYTYTPPTQPNNITGRVIDTTDGKKVSDIQATVTQQSNGKQMISMDAKESVVLKQPDGTNSQFEDVSRITVTTETGSTVAVPSNGTLNIQDLDKGSTHKYNLTYDLGNGQKINIGSMNITIDASGNVDLTTTLIDPCGIISDEATGQVLEGVKVTLYYADTARNKASGKTPGTMVPLPGINGFKPNNNQNPQISDVSGAYGYMVFPNADYTIVAAKDGYLTYTSPTIPVEQDLVKWNFNMHVQGTARLYGETRVDTALALAKATYPNPVKNVILATAGNYPDALAGSVLAYQQKAPILLVGNTQADLDKILAYLKDNLDPNGTVFVLGGTAAVSDNVVEQVQAAGFKNFVRLGGFDRYETDVKIVDYLQVKEGTPVVIAYGENYPDALAVSSAAAINQYPILLAGKHGLADSVKTELKKLKPVKVYIIGGTGVISTDVENLIAGLTALDSKSIIRIGGFDRYETSLKVAQYFSFSGKNLCIATGQNFPDALAGSIYAATYNAPILLADGNLTDAEKEHIRNSTFLAATIFGGTGAVEESILNEVSGLMKKN